MKPKKNTTPTTGITKYQKTSKMVDIVKECKLVEVSNEVIKNVIEFDTGIRVTNAQLDDLIETARKEVREQQIEVDIHMEEMIKYGLYKDTMRQHTMLTRIEQIIYSMIIEESVKQGGEKNRNLLLAMSNTLTKVFGAKNNTITNIGFLSKTKALLEERMEGGGASSGETGTDLNKKTTILIKDKKEDVEKLVNDVIDIKELQNNRVA